MNLKEFDRVYLSEGYTCIAGFDEAGRGPICGPVVAAGAVMEDDFFDSRIDDSKKVSDRLRRELFSLIKEHAKACSVVFISPEEIDRINILEASRLGMYQALLEIQRQGQKVDLCLTDYMKLPTSIKVVALKKGDATSFSIACASILAKVSRDLYMEKLDRLYPQYELARHKGYPTRRHLELLEKYGPIPEVYRFSYAPVKNMTEKVY